MNVENPSYLDCIDYCFAATGGALMAGLLRQTYWAIPERIELSLLW